jgi:hypothetical protein
VLVNLSGCLAKYLGLPTQETVSPSALKKGKRAATRDDSEETVGRPKRHRKLTTMDAALQYVIDEADEVGHV